MLEIFKKIIKKTPWLFLLLITFWLVVLGIVAYRYFNIEKKLNSYLNADYAGESNVDSITDSSYQIMKQLNNGNIGINERQAIILHDSNARQFINLEEVALYTDRGELHTVYNNGSNLYTLFFNQLPISQIPNPNVIYAFTFTNHNLMLIFDAEVVHGDHIYSMLEISDSSKRLVHELGNYESMTNAILSPNGNCIFMKFNDARKYTEEGDYQVYQYCGGGNVFKILDVKSEDYYQQKFAGYSARKIIQAAQKEQCIDSLNNRFIMTRECNYGIKYCYMLRQMVNPVKDKYYEQLFQMCNSSSTGMIYQQIMGH